MRSRSLLLVALATLLLHASASASDDDLDYLIDNADDIPANDPDGWLQEGSPTTTTTTTSSTMARPRTIP
ncbi:hypothetical protein EE612_008244 [Oryza sativa]|nr:hypothetical protein EE612_008244 [Oryza sativa]